jgi:mannose-6-phosphate isomerase-like protein (cupin superfamily)
MTGKGEIVVNGDKVRIMPNQSAVIEPGEVHSISEVSDGIELVYFGIH